MRRPRLLIATTSAGKLREWQGLLADLPLDLVRLSDAGIDFEVDETGSTFRENALLIRFLEGKTGRARACLYACVVVLRHPDGRTWYARGGVHGHIATAPAGSGGFGYDPIFYVPRLGRTLAEIPI